VLVAAALALGAPAEAGTTHASPPVNVVPGRTSAPVEPDDLPGPQPEVAKHPAKLELPPVPAFDLPAGEPGVHTPRELRVHAPPDAVEVKVKGYVTWIYDCAAELAGTNPGAARVQIAEAISNDPTLCERPMFTLGDDRDTRRDASLWILDAPPARPNERAGSATRLARGDYVIVTGARSDAEASLVYRAFERAVPATARPAATPADATEPEITVETEIPLRRIIDTAIRNASVDQLNACNRALAARQYDAAIAACRAATELWRDNHLAWYGAASAHLMKHAWDQAAAAIERAVTLRPDQAMYQLYDGVARYEAERQRARTGRAPAAPADHAEPSPRPLDAARDALLRAARLSPALWRAHYYLGRLYRELGDDRRAAEQLTQAIAAHPGYRPGYTALIDLYRRWDYLDQAIAIGKLGATQVAAADAAELWFALGQVYEAQNADDRAIEAFSHAITGAPGHPGAKLARAALYVGKDNLGAARRDLEDVARLAEPRDAAARQHATQLLAQLVRRTQRGWSGGHTGELHLCWRVYRPSDEPYQPWSPEDAKLRF
jgi:tetratricopeptide (TPR) repeat protein